MAVSMWVAPFALDAGRRGVMRLVGIGFLVELLALFFVILLLRRRLSVQIDRLADQHELLASQNVRLMEQNLRLDEGQRREHAMAQELKVLNRRLAEAQSVAQIGYWEIDPITHVVFWSNEMFRLCGVDPDGAPPAENFLGTVHADDRRRMRDVSTRALSDLTEFTEQYRIVTGSGAVRTVQSKGRVIADASGRQKLIGTIQDVTDRVKLETKLRQSQKMDAVGQLAGGIAHDFNNVLTVIEGYSTLLLRARPADDPDRQHLDEIRDAARRASTLTRQLLAFSRQQVLQPRVIDLNATIGGVEMMLRRLIGEHIDFRTTLELEVDLVKADPGQIEQVLMNLVLNARDAMPRGGTLTIETANVVLDESYAQRHPVKTPGPHVMLAVSDTGTGIPPGELHRIFEPFYTTKEAGKGTGLGLATVHGIVEQSGGHVWVYSEVGRGSTFKVYLPRCETADATALGAQLELTSRKGSGTILLVEDEDSLRTLAATILRRAGYTVIEARNGAEALRFCDDPTLILDLLITDMVMPAMGGRDLVTFVKRLRPRLPTLLMSGYTRDAMLHSADLSAGASFIEKPFTPEALTHKVREVLDRTNAFV
jgi:two-component system cell cycle sensor histidine kinase/response regulator CckA